MSLSRSQFHQKWKVTLQYYVENVLEEEEWAIIQRGEG